MHHNRHSVAESTRTPRRARCAGAKRPQAQPSITANPLVRHKLLNVHVVAEFAGVLGREVARAVGRLDLLELARERLVLDVVHCLADELECEHVRG